MHPAPPPPARTWRRRLAALAVTSVVVAVVVAVLTVDHPPLELAGSDRVEVRSPRDADVALAAVRLRNTGDADLVVTGVALGSPAGPLRAGAPGPPGAPAVVGDLVAAPVSARLPAAEPGWPPAWLDTSYTAVDGQVVAPGGELQLVFRLGRTTDGTAVLGPLELDYRVGADTAHATLGLEVALEP